MSEAWHITGVGYVAETRQDVGNLVHGLQMGNAICMNLGTAKVPRPYNMRKGSPAKQGLAWDSMHANPRKGSKQGTCLGGHSSGAGWLKHKIWACG